MAAVFGIDERDAQGFLEKGIVCLPNSSDGKPDLHGVVSAIRNSDLVFIKRCTPLSSLHIKAVGIVQSDFPVADGAAVCLPVEWVWRGEKTLDNFDEELSLCGDPLYEEHNILVQRAIVDLLPDRYRLAQEW